MRQLTTDQKINIRALYAKKGCAGICSQDFSKGIRTILFRLDMLYGPRHFKLWTSNARYNKDYRVLFAIITYTGDGRMFWNNTAGWVDHTQRDLFDGKQRRTLRLPIGGEWLKVIEPRTNGEKSC